MRDFVKIYPYLANLLGSLGTLAIAGFIPQALASEQITLKLGPIQQSIPLAALETFAQTGTVLPSLQPYRPVLTKQVQALLQEELQVDPILAQQFLEDLFNSSDGENLLKQLQTLIPDSTPEEIHRTLTDFLECGQPINVLNILKAYPQKSLQIDLGAVAILVANLQAKKVQSEILTSSLGNALAVSSPPNTSRVLPNPRLRLQGSREQGAGEKVENPSPPPTHLPTFDPAASGKEVVYRELMVFNDQSRHRSIAADIYTPETAQGPMVIMSHGFAADRHFLKYLADHLASHGITVVAIEHPGSNIHALAAIAEGVGLKNVLPAEEFIDRPKDISFVLDELEKLNQTDSYLRGKFNTSQVTVIGHSFGGYTALALAGAQLNPKALRHFCENSQPLGRSPADWLQCAASELPYRHLNARDTRVVQAIVLDPIIGELFAQDLAAVTIPVLMLAASQDGITPIISHQLQPFAQLKGEKYLLLALGATHMSVTDISYLSSTMGQSTLVQEVMDERAEPVRRMIRATSLAFIKQQTPRAVFYQPYLRPDYVQSLSTPDLGLRLTTRLPLDLALLTFNYSPDAPDEQILSPFSRLFDPPTQETGYLEPIFGSLLQQYYQDIQGLG